MRPMARTVIGILGKPLSGKDTVAETLRLTHPSLAAISMGDVVREVKAVGPAHRFWDLLKDSIAVADAGGIAPDEPIFRCITLLIEEQFRSGKDTVLWVGGPRSEQQVRWLDAWVTENGYHDQFLHIDVPDGEVYARLNDRLRHGRADDRTDVIAFRLTEYERVTAPAVSRLAEEGKLRQINGVGSKESVAAHAAAALGLPGIDPETSLPLTSRR
jgi:adenylate kinase family enzyme